MVKKKGHIGKWRSDVWSELAAWRDRRDRTTAERELRAETRRKFRQHADDVRAALNTLEDAILRGDTLIGSAKDRGPAGRTLMRLQDIFGRGLDTTSTCWSHRCAGRAQVGRQPSIRLRHKLDVEELANYVAGQPIHYVRCDRPLVYEVNRLRRIVRAEAITYAVIDSIGYATDGPPEAAESAMAYFRAVRQLGIGTLSIAHGTTGSTPIRSPLDPPSTATPRVAPGTSSSRTGRPTASRSRSACSTARRTSSRFAPPWAWKSGSHRTPSRLSGRTSPMSMNWRPRSRCGSG
jgi:hypothetical protein